MGDWTLKQTWSLNGHGVPLVQGKADVEDIWTLSDTGSLETRTSFLELEGDRRSLDGQGPPTQGQVVVLPLWHCALPARGPRGHLEGTV